MVVILIIEEEYFFRFLYLNFSVKLLGNYYCLWGWYLLKSLINLIIFEVGVYVFLVRLIKL